MKRTTKLGTLAAAAGLAATTLLPMAPAGAAGTENAAFGFRGVNGASTSQPITNRTWAAVSGTDGTASAAQVNFFTAGTGTFRARATGGVTSAITPTSGSANAAGVQLYQGVSASAPPELTADAVATTCSFDQATGTVSGSTSITNGQRLITPSVPLLALPSSPAPNTSGTGVGTSYVLNRQTTNPDGSLTVDGLVYTDGLGATFTVGSVTCQPAELLAVDAVDPLVGLGVAGALGTVGGAAWYARSRRRPVLAAAARPAAG
ncbi:MAG TPA: hypothetical protein VHK88_04835 [Aquihabitans sp.]|jgi:hypothetical protein|nr:hypothetical protein [Aquihabitans sp.]